MKSLTKAALGALALVAAAGAASPAGAAVAFGFGPGYGAYYGYGPRYAVPYVCRDYYRPYACSYRGYYGPRFNGAYRVRPYGFRGYRNGPRYGYQSRRWY
jgi:hypothetical protein